MRRNIYRRYTDRETLERLKQYPSMMNRFPKVRIYSAEWGAFWNGKGNGYTQDPQKSDVWSCEEAFRQTQHCGPEKGIQFVKVEKEPETKCRWIRQFDGHFGISCPTGNRVNGNFKGKDKGMKWEFIYCPYCGREIEEYFDDDTPHSPTKKEKMSHD